MNKRFCATIILLTIFILVAKANYGDIIFKSGGKMYCQLSGSTVALVGARANSKGVIDIPSQITKDGKTMTVVEVGKWHGTGGYRLVDMLKFKSGEDNNCKAVTKVIIPNTITSIRYEVFKDLVNLKEINLPSSLKLIDDEAFYNCKSLTSIVIPPSVTQIGSRAFGNCEGLKELVLPNSITTLGEWFNFGCDKMETLIMPDNKPKEDLPYYKRSTGKSFSTWLRVLFARKLTIKGNKTVCPAYVVEDIEKEKRLENPDFWKSEYLSPWITTTLPRLVKTFSYFVQDRPYTLMEQWQKKKDIETAEQYKERMSETNQKKQFDAIVIQLQQEYVIAKAPSSPSKTSLGDYDSEYSTYVVLVDGMTTYAKVPQKDAGKFKSNWSKVEVIPQYGVIDDNLGILSCKFQLNGKTYNSPQTYSNDNSSLLAANLTPIDISSHIDNDNSNAPNNEEFVSSDDIDTNIPVAKTKDNNTFAVIIGNENYQRVAKVQYAANDAKIFGEYCQKTLGIPAQNIRKYNDATYGAMLSALQDIRDVTDAYDGDASVIFYYAGHGIPSETDQRAYLLPVDADGKQTIACVPLNTIYNYLGALKAKNVVVFLDACFSGSQRGDGMLASARGVAIKPKAEQPQGNLVVLSAASDSETAFPYKEKRHGLFTYYLLKDLQQTKGDVTLGDLADFVTKNVKQQSVVINRKPQTPTVTSSPSISSYWKAIKFN